MSGFPVPDFDDVTAVFGARLDAYLKWEEIPAEFLDGIDRFSTVADSLFLNGGKLADHGLKLKAGIDPVKAHKAIRALLCSFEPKHEVKIGTVAVALRDWCEDATEEDRKPDKPKAPAKSKKQKRAKARVRRTA